MNRNTVKKSERKSIQHIISSFDCNVFTRRRNAVRSWRDFSTGLRSPLISRSEPDQQSRDQEKEKTTKYDAMMRTRNTCDERIDRETTMQGENSRYRGRFGRKSCNTRRNTPPMKTSKPYQRNEKPIQPSRYSNTKHTQLQLKSKHSMFRCVVAMCVRKKQLRQNKLCHARQNDTHTQSKESYTKISNHLSYGFTFFT